LIDSAANWAGLSRSIAFPRTAQPDLEHPPFARDVWGVDVSAYIKSGYEKALKLGGEELRPYWPPRQFWLLHTQAFLSIFTQEN
jgi:hypothetical protein